MARLADMTSLQVAESLGEPTTTLVIPFGAVEQHGPHLPLKVDAFVVDAVVLEAADQLSPEIEILVAPPVHYGCSEYHMGFPGTFSIGFDAYIGFVDALLVSAEKHGFKRVVLINGHGGNAAPLAVAVRRFGPTPMKIALASYWDFAAEVIASQRKSPSGGISHAGEMETSLMLYLEPDSVVLDHVADVDLDPGPPGTGEDLLAPGFVAIPGDVDAVSSSGVMGRPSDASTELGEAVFIAAALNLAKFLKYFASDDPTGPARAITEEMDQ